MNDLQIKYFLKAAQRLNFSEAAKELFITQPALSQQITAIEKELNMQLFIRDKNKLRLTPAAIVLMQELPKCSRMMQEAFERARIISDGHSAILKMGVLEGQILSPNFRAAYHAFEAAYPNIHIEFTMDSFSGLRKGLDEKKLDIAFTINFDIKNSPSYLWVTTDVDTCAVFAAKSHPLNEKKVHSWKDLKDETIVLVDGEDSAIVQEMVLADCEDAGFIPKFLLAHSLNEQMLWIDAGRGVGISNTDSYLYANPNVCCLKEMPIKGNYFVLAWHRENINSAIALFTNFVADYIEKNKLI
ncbi:MAG: LysR family transcriptional regulator [Oscillospiraceae bacterium]|nr:LysR family transcriptional regulator [Oscillospiraceae bacterium]